MCFDHLFNQYDASGNKREKGGKLAPAAVPSRGAIPGKAKGTRGKIVKKRRPCNA